MNDARHTFAQKLPDRIYVRALLPSSLVLSPQCLQEHCALYRSTVSGLQTSLTAFGDYQRYPCASLFREDADWLISDIATIWTKMDPVSGY
jgi:hypothetical protein